MVRIPTPQPIIVPADRVVRDPADLEGQAMDGALYGEVFIEQVAAFPEPDHTPELEAQRHYEAVRDDPDYGAAFLGVDDPTGRVGQERQGGALPVEIHRGRRGLCNWPSHAQWAVDMFGKSRDDQHTDD